MFEDKRLNELAAATERQAEGLRPRLRNLDRSLTILGSETGKVLIIMLALAVLCAPAGLGLVAAWLAWLGVIAATGSGLDRGLHDNCFLLSLCLGFPLAGFGAARGTVAAGAAVFALTP
jgi:hypothetical protein